MKLKLWMWIIVFVLAMGLSGCADTPAAPGTPTPVNTPVANAPAANTPAANNPGATTPAATTGKPAGAITPPLKGSPVFSFMPKQGPAGILLHAAGAYFKPASTV